MRLLARSFAALTVMTFAGSAAFAMEDGSGSPAPGSSPSWNLEHVDLGQPQASPGRGLDLQRTEVWSSGLWQSGQTLPTDPQKTVGAKLRPFADLDLLVGTQMSRDQGVAGPLDAKMDWQFGWSKQWAQASNLQVGLSTSGSLDRTRAAYSQSAGGSLGIHLLPEDLPWSTQLVVSPSVNLNTTTGAWNADLKSEIVTQRELSTHASPIQSVVNVRLGYDVAPNTRPSASAKLELQFTPRS